MFKKIWFGIFACSTLFALENEPFPNIDETISKEKDSFRYISFGSIVIVPTVGLGIRTRTEKRGNDFSYSCSYFPFKTQNHTHFFELKGNVPIWIPSLSYGVSF